MAVASLFGGLALANAGLGAVHGLAGPLGGMIRAPHGAVCAALLPAVVAANLKALRMRAPAGDALSRYAVVAQLLTGDPAATPGDAINWLRRLVADLQIPGLGLYGVDQALITELVQNASRASSMKANPVELSRDELAAIVNEAL
jgi:alcohol dehydrogenase class IV